MTTEDRIKNLAHGFVDKIRQSVVIRKAILDAFAAFDPEPISLEVLAFETELTCGEVATALDPMFARGEVAGVVEDFVISSDGTESNKVAFPMYDSQPEMAYRVNKEWKAQ